MSWNTCWKNQNARKFHSFNPLSLNTNIAKLSLKNGVVYSNKIWGKFDNLLSYFF